MATPRTLKLIRYEQTQSLLQGINREAESEEVSLPKAAGSETQTYRHQSAPSSSSSLHKLRTDFNQRALMRSHLEDLVEILNEHDKAQGTTSFLKAEYNRLINRINLGVPVSLQEFEAEVKKFSANHEYVTALQDEINNKRLDLEVRPEEDADIDQPSNIIEFPQPEQGEQEEIPQTQQTNEQEDSSPTGQQKRAPQEPRRIIIQQPQKPQYGMNKEEYAKYKEEHKEERSARARELWAQRKAARDSSEDDEEKKKERLRRPGENQPQGKNPLGDKIDNWAKNKFKNSRLGKSLNNRFGNSRVGRGITRANRILNTPYRLANNLTSRIGNRLGNTNLGRGVTRINNLLNTPARLLNNLAGRLGNVAGNALRNLGSQAARAALNLGTQAAKFLANTATQGLSNLASQAAGSAARTAAGTAARSLAIALFNPITLGIILLVGLFIFILWFAGEQDKSANSECGQPGTIQVLKGHKGAGQDLNLPNRPESTSNIEYEIVVVYNIRCVTATTDLEIRDPIPPNTFVSASAVVNRLPTDPHFSDGLDSQPEAQGQQDGNTVVWKIKGVKPQREVVLFLVVNPKEAANDSWITNQATVSYRTYSLGATSGVSGLLPESTPPLDWENIKAGIIAAFNKYPELLAVYREASDQTGIPWQFLAGLHYVETGSNPRPGVSLVSGRFIGEVEPDVTNARKCAQGIGGPGVPIPIGGGCGFATQTDSAIYAANHLAGKIGKIPTTFPEAVEAISRYNGGGNANCGEGLPYGPCPPQFYGEDDPYPMADFDEPHSSKLMYILFSCGDGVRNCPPKLFNRPGAMAVVRALIEEGI